MGSEHKISWFVLIIILSLYLFFPSGFSTTDGWAYAASVKHVGEIFHPHHLLYNALGLVFSWLPAKAGFEIIACMKVLNAIFAFLTLLVSRQLLYSFKVIEKQVVIITCLAGLSFGVLRYATENETYIVPLFFALLASFNYIKFMTGGKTRHAFYSGLWATIAVLFHQIYIFWWFGLLLGVFIERKKKPTLIYIIISLIAPVAYLIVILANKGGIGWSNINDFLFKGFGENIRFEITGIGILLSFINLIRSFIQVHGYILNMVRENMLWIIPGVVSLFFVVLALLRLPGRGKTIVSPRFSTIHIIIMLLQFIFAMFSFGNAEFMVMIPVLAFILVPFFYLNFEKFLVRILIAVAVWNTSYGLIPLHYKSQAPEQVLCDLALAEKKVIIVASDDQLIKSMIYYQTGEENRMSVIKSPAHFEIKGKDQKILEGVIDSALINSIDIFTNCLDKETISRSTILEGAKNKVFFLKYESTLIYSSHQFTGTRSVYRVVRKL